MKQASFSQLEYEGKRRKTRRELFLADMERVVPWSALEAVIEPYYPKGRRGRPPIGLMRMLRVYFVQQWYGLSDEGVEDAITDSQALRAFVGVDLSRESAPDATTLLHFRRLLEQNDLTTSLFEAINTHLKERGLMMQHGTIADATLLSAPPSTKNKSGERDPEMHQAKKGEQWYFGMKAHIGMDAESGLVHTVVGTAANVGDITQTHKLLHGEEQAVFLDAGYTGAPKREELKGLDVDWHISARRSKIERMPDCSQFKPLFKEVERLKSSIRAKVEHAFHVIKNLFHYKKVRYKGLAKNTAQLHVLFGLANLMTARKQLLAPHGKVAS